MPAGLSQRPVRRRWRQALFAAALVGAVLLPTLLNELTWDDRYLVAYLEGPGRSVGLGELLAAPFWDNSTAMSGSHTALWRPITTLLIATTHALAGPRPAAYHLVSVVAALAAALALAAVLRRVAGDRDAPEALWLALILAVHPLAVEVVCLAANAADLVALAALAAALLVAWDLQEGRPARWRAPLLVLAGLLACGAKETGVLVAGTPLAAWALRRAAGRAAPIRDLGAPLTWLAAVSPVVIYLALRQLVLSRAGEAGLIDAAGLSPRAVFHGYGQLLVQAVVPLPRGVSLDVDTSAPLSVLTSAVPWAALLLAAVLARWGRAGAGLAALGLLLSLALLLPSLLRAELSGATGLSLPTRYGYLPLAGLLLAVSPFAGRLARRRRFGLALPAVALLMALLSAVRVQEWRDDVALFHAETVHAPHSVPARLDLLGAMINARAYRDAERAAGEIDPLPAAREPGNRARLLYARGRIALLADGDHARAVSLLEEALAITPDDFEVAVDLARAHSLNGDADRAAAVIERSLARPRVSPGQRSILRQELGRLR